ncbi:MAG TPA: hypothetical protein VD908_14045 [Cytophagales bacterium]|nr:hypothetical protein [Cytophagales bacterium]
MANGTSTALNNDFNKTIEKAQNFERKEHGSFATNEAEKSQKTAQALGTATGFAGFIKQIGTTTNVIGVALGFTPSIQELAKKGVELSSTQTRTVLGKTQKVK